MAGLQPPPINPDALAAPGVQPGVANPLPQMQIPVPPVAAAAVRHRTFASYYMDESKDPVRLRYASILHRFDAVGDKAQDADALLQGVLGNPTIPNSFLCCAVLSGSPKIYVIHMLSKFTPVIDG
jgi:hypothetical protein